MNQNIYDDAYVYSTHYRILFVSPNIYDDVYVYSTHYRILVVSPNRSVKCFKKHMWHSTDYKFTCEPGTSVTDHAVLTAKFCVCRNANDDVFLEKYAACTVLI